MAKLAIASTTIPVFIDGWEDGVEWTNWSETTGTGWALSVAAACTNFVSTCADGNYCICAENGATNVLTSRTINLAGQGDCVLNWYAGVDSSFDNSEFAYVDVNNSGGTWTTIWSCTNGQACENNAWTAYQYNITGGVGLNSNFAVRLRAVGNDATEELLFDNVTVVCAYDEPIPYNPNITYVGDCDTECNVTTSYYKAVLKEGIVWNLTYNFSDETTYFSRTISGTNNAGLNAVFNAAGAGIMAATITTTSSANISGNNTNNLNITFSNSNAWQKYEFYQQYYKTEALASTSAMRYYYFLHNGSTRGGAVVGDDLVFNSTNRQSAQTGFTDSESTRGLVAAVYNLSITNYSFNILFNWTLTTDYDYQASSSASSGMGIAIARSSEIAQGAILTTINEVRKRNISASTFDQSIYDTLNQHYSERNIFTSTPATCYTVTTGLIIIPPDCYFSLASLVLEALI